MLNWWPGALGVVPGVLLGLLNYALLGKMFSVGGSLHTRKGIFIAGRLVVLFAALALEAWIYLPALPFIAAGYTLVLFYRLVRLR